MKSASWDRLCKILFLIPYNLLKMIIVVTVKYLFFVDIEFFCRLYNKQIDVQFKY